ncbi:hypothetical protein [Bifidobacterium psychraerophilum]|uniref:hypothetical protein n=1 Tax=Bifidobacterium psychraerophilum TaxID=218140 RepID=UPI00126A1B13|nr:hypothetical protein [Bifidobacterium psychraerophilum]
MPNDLRLPIAPTRKNQYLYAYDDGITVQEICQQFYQQDPDELQEDENTNDQHQDPRLSVLKDVLFIQENNKETDGKDD